MATKHLLVADGLLNSFKCGKRNISLTFSIYRDIFLMDKIANYRIRNIDKMCVQGYLQ